MTDRDETFEEKLASTSSIDEARDVFSKHIHRLGYNHFDAASMHAALLANPRKASRFFVCDYYKGDPWKYLPKGWPADDELIVQASRSSSPIDYLDHLKTCDPTASILVQRGMLKTWNIKYAWLFPHNTLGFLRTVACYMLGKEENQEEIFLGTRDELFSQSALFIDHLEHLHQQEQVDKEGTMVVQKMPVGLSDIEMTVLLILSKGHSNQKIAEIMDISIHTVRYHLKRIYKKIGVSTRSEAVVAAIDNGFVAR